MPNVFIYLDAAHAGWLGWPKNLPKAVALFKEVIDEGGRPRSHPRLRAERLELRPVQGAAAPRRAAPTTRARTSSATSHDLAAGLAKVGITGKGFIIDTSRNGRAGSGAPGNWCNVKGAGLGERPTAAPAPNIDAYFWVKTPGESDGTADRKAARFDENCVSDDAMPGAPEAGELFAPYLIELAKNAQPPL